MYELKKEKKVGALYTKIKSGTVEHPVRKPNPAKTIYINTQVNGKLAKHPDVSFCYV